MRYIDKYPGCNGCPVIKYCGTQCMSVRLCNSYQEPEPEIGTKEFFDLHDCYDAIGGDWEG